MHTLMERSSSGSSHLPDDVTRISVAKDFSETPFGRYKADGPESGEVFRETLLRPALQRGQVELNIDGVDGLPSSFWEEALGGMIRGGFPLGELEAKLTIVCKEPELQTFVRSGWRFAREAAEKLAAH